MPGMRRSSRSRSAGFARSISSASAPLEAEPRTSTPAWVPSMLVRPASTTGGSSTIRMRIGLYRLSDINPMFLSVFPEPLWPVGECNARRQRRGYYDARACAGLCLNLEFGRDALSASPHAANAEAMQKVALYKACAVVLDLKDGQVFAAFEANSQDRGVRVADGIGNGLLADVVEGIRNAQGQWPLVAFPLQDNLNRAAFHHAPGASVQYRKDVRRFQRLRTKRCNAAARLFVAVADKVAGEIELLLHRRIFLTKSVANRVQVESDAGEALRQGIVHFVGHALALFQYSLETPVRYAVINEVY